MSEVRMSLAQAGEVLGIRPNSVRSRWKNGKIRGERDNAGKVWVWLDPEKAANDKASKEPSSKASIEGFERREIKALEAHVKTLSEQLSGATAELETLRPQATEAVRLEAEIAGIRAQLAEAKESRDRERSLLEAEIEQLRARAEKAEERGESLQAEILEHVRQPKRRGLFGFFRER